MRIDKMIQLKIMLAVCFSVIVFSLLAPLFAPNDPLAADFANILSPPSEHYPFGTDQVGRCLQSRIFYGAKLSLGLTFLSLTLIFVLGITIGITSAMAGGVVDEGIMRAADTVLAFPDIVFAIAIAGIIGPGLVNTLIALSIIWWTKYARMTRVLVLDVLHETYIDAAVMSGAGYFKIIVTYILPNIISKLVIQLSMDVGSMMLTLAGLSFLGLGVRPPAPEWGNMLQEGRIYIQTNPGLLIYPGAAIFIVVILFNILGDTIRDVLDPKETGA